ncbi:sulfite exporter TauE/SafE family protein [Methylomonas sp. MED-D]|uniref:sulfite exporter TauE/SafE family protein n=1 Tax=Methylomonas sp. MED-D TaxID=3418768 RepID=UPI003D02D647
MITAFALAIAIGLLLGLLGGGGSILTVPVLVYLLHVAPKTAIATSFVVVGISSLMALIPHAQRGHVCWKSALAFGTAGMLGAFGGGRLAGQFSGDLLMALFGLVTLVTALAMIANKRPPRPDEVVSGGLCPLNTPYPRLLFDGLLVGGLTGLVGVGGGFLIVPALVLLVDLPMTAAIGTSLLIIVINAVAGLAGYSNHAELDLTLTLTFTGGAVVGSLLGGWLSNYLSPAALRRGFGWFVLLVAGYVLSNAVTAELWSELQDLIADRAHVNRLLAGIAILLTLLLIGGRIHRRPPGAPAKRPLTH